jgi:hypothetical protein
MFLYRNLNGFYVVPMPAEMTNTNGSHDTKNVIESWFGNQRVFLLKCTSQCMLGKILGKHKDNLTECSQQATDHIQR